MSTTVARLDFDAKYKRINSSTNKRNRPVQNDLRSMIGCCPQATTASECRHSENCHVKFAGQEGFADTNGRRQADLFYRFFICSGLDSIVS